MSKSSDKPIDDLATLSTRERFEFLLDTIRERIVQLDYPPGSRIGEEELAQEFGISRTPLRRVLNRLEFEEFVEIRHGSGNYVTEIDEQKMDEYYRLRISLYEVAGNFSEKPLSVESLDKMNSILDDVISNNYNLSAQSYRILNIKFQKLTNECIENSKLVRFIDQLYFYTYRHWFFWQQHLNWFEEIDDFIHLMQEVIRCHEINDTKGAYVIRRNFTVGMLHRINAVRQLISPE